MIYRLSDNIISPLGFNSKDNYSQIKNGNSGLKPYENRFNLPEPFFVSLINEEEINDRFSTLPKTTNEKYTKLEKLSILSCYDAINLSNINPSSKDVIFVFSTTKGNVELLEENKEFEKERVYLWKSAQVIKDYFHNPNQPIVVTNACISGVAAQLTAFSFLNNHNFKYAIVVGAEVLSKFIISGFQSFKALSMQMCKPFDRDRDGLNLGEGAATIVYKLADNNEVLPKDRIEFISGAVRNDANHISGPSRTGEGLFNAISETIKGYDTNKLSFINAHATSTPYNDNMESFAIERGGINNVPVNSLKPYLGHTLGAAGILETIISFHSLIDNTIIKTLNHQNYGVEKSIIVNVSNKESKKPAFIKLISGFGGSNAAIMFEKLGYDKY